MTNVIVLIIVVVLGLCFAYFAIAGLYYLLSWLFIKCGWRK